MACCRVIYTDDTQATANSQDIFKKNVLQSVSRKIDPEPRCSRGETVGAGLIRAQQIRAVFVKLREELIAGEPGHSGQTQALSSIFY
jgi:hypothetical protein